MKKILAILLTLCMVAWTIPAAAFAEGDDTGTAVDLTKAVISISSGGAR